MVYLRHSVGAMKSKGKEATMAIGFFGLHNITGSEVCYVHKAKRLEKREERNFWLMFAKSYLHNMEILILLLHTTVQTTKP